ncbi:MAG: YceI family protein [Betaproteobacteria bacterium]|nr:YceI family protein [Betaproteobacteria bacterium]
MRTRSARGLVVAGLLAVACAAAAVEYRVDPAETRAGFEVTFLGVIPIRGEFSRVSGTLRFDDGQETGGVDIVIDATSLAGGGATARGKDFFHVARYPVIEFHSSRFLFEQGRLKQVEGKLTLTGQRHPVTLDMHAVTCDARMPPQPRRCRADAEVTVKRNRFGMTGWAMSVSDDVTIRIRLAAIEIAPAASAAVPQ